MNMNADSNQEDKFENILDNINTIYEELIRQFNIYTDIFNRYNRTLEVMMGFIAIILTYMVAQKDFFQIITFENEAVVFLFSVGLIFLILSGIFCFIAYGLRDYHVGPETKDLLKKFGEKANYNLKLKLFNEVYDCSNQNQRMLESKRMWINGSYLLLGCGFLLILITKSIYYIYTFGG